MTNETPPTLLLLETYDPEIKATLQEIAALDAQDLPDEQYQKWLVENQEAVFLQRDLSGKLQAGQQAIPTNTREQITDWGETLDPNFAVLRDSAEPNVRLSIGMVLAGLGLIILLISRQNARPIR